VLTHADDTRARTVKSESRLGTRKVDPTPQFASSAQEPLMARRFRLGRCWPDLLAVASPLTDLRARMIGLDGGELFDDIVPSQEGRHPGLPEDSPVRPWGASPAAEQPSRRRVRR
jgi:hypothetical protein